MSKQIPIPAAAAAAGMTKLVFEDDFDTIDTIAADGNDRPEHKWFTRCYGSTTTADRISVQDSYLRLEAESYGIATYSRPLDQGFTVTCGCYLECRMRAPMPNGEYGGWPAFWTMGLDDFMGREWKRAGELDVVELFVTKNEKGEDQKYFAGSLHEHYRTGKLINGRWETFFANNTVNSTGYLDQFPFTDDDWHVYGALWEPGKVTWYMDGVEMHSVTYAEGKMPDFFYRDDPTPLTNEPPLYVDEITEEMFPDNERWRSRNRGWVGAYTVLDDDVGVVLLTARKTFPMDVDWVRIWRA